MADDPFPRPTWGLLPEAAVAMLRRKEWENIRNLKARLRGGKTFPIELGLRPPKGNLILDDMNHFQRFVSAWNNFSPPVEVQWETRGYRHISKQDVPVRLIIRDISSLAKILGTREVNQLEDWQAKISFILSKLSSNKTLFDRLVEHLDTIGHYQQTDLELLVSLIPQLKQGLGNGNYLRSLPLVNVDTKFIETHFKLVEDIVDVLHDGTVKPIGMLAWLGCQAKPKDWLLIKPLCEQTRSALGGLPLLRLSTETLIDYELPARRILVIENEQSCLALPRVPDTISVSGGGKNVAWMSAVWLAKKKTGYWGDIDSEGLNILSDVRSKLSTVVPLMMNEATVLAFQERMVPEPDSVISTPLALSCEEQKLFNRLRAGQFNNARLEQERISADYVQSALTSWLSQ